MRWSLRFALGCLLAAARFVSAGAAMAETGILAFSGESHHRIALDPLIDFGAGRVVSIVPHMGALMRHAAADGDLVLLFLETSEVRTAEKTLADVVLYDESDIGRDVRKLVSEPGGTLLFETPVGISDPESAPLARLAVPNGATYQLYFDRGLTALPEPDPLMSLAAGAAMLLALAQRRRRVGT